MSNKILFFKGNFRSQFIIDDKKNSHRSDCFEFAIQLEPRFYLNQAEEITEIEFNDYVDLSKTKWHIRHSKKDVIEIEFRNGQTKNEISESLLLFQENLENQPAYWRYLTKTSDQGHGKLQGFAVCKIVSVSPEEKEKSITKIIQAKPIQSRRGWTSIFSGQTLKSPSEAAVTGLNNPNGLNRGCLGMGAGNPLGSASGLGASGCMSQTGGCARIGCGILGLLFLIGLLSALLKQCNQTNSNMQPQVVHDTVYVEVIKERIDTLEVVRFDTIAFVDSTIESTIDPITLPNIQFETNKATLLPTSFQDIQTLAEFLKKHPEAKATIIGHTDDRGDDQKNMILSQARARAVKNVLEQFGVNPANVTAIGKGETEPKNKDKTSEALLQNRRVEVQLDNLKSVKNNRTTL